MIMRLANFALSLGILFCASLGFAGEAGKRVTVYMYSEYIDPELPKEFEKLTGMPVKIDVYENTEEMMAKLQQAGGVSQYDVVVVSDHAIPVLARLGLIQPLGLEKIPNAKNVSAQFKKPPYDPDEKYSLPYQWGTVGLMYRKDKLGQADPSWSLLLNPAKQPGPVVLIDSMRDMLGVALKSLGASVNSKKVEELKEAGQAILRAKRSPKCLGFEGGVGGRNKVADGSALVAIVYSGDAIKAVAEDAHLAYVLPREGAIVWVDAMTISAKAPNAEGAHAFINFILDPEVGARLSNFNRCGTPNGASLGRIRKEDRENPAIYPPAEELKKLEYIEDVGDTTRLYDEVWTAAKAR